MGWMDIVILYRIFSVTCLPFNILELFLSSLKHEQDHAGIP